MATRSIRDGILVGTGVDYVTATSTTWTSEVELVYIGQALIREARAGGNRERAWTANGYTGMACGPVSMGRGDAGGILRVSGDRAASVCREIISVADNVSRIDLQSTVRFNRDIYGLARRHGEELQRVQRERTRRIRARVEYTYGRGDTLYVGSRSSNYYGRVYDKERESKSAQYRRCWRYELECKGDGAKMARRLLDRSGADPLPVAAAVHAWYRRHGVVPRWRPGACDELEPVGRGETEAERSLIWLHDQVAPVVRRLQEWYSRRDLVALVFDGAEPGQMRPNQLEEDQENAAYDAWTIETRSVR